MKKVKLLKDWKDPNGKEWKAGTQLEINDEATIAEICKNGFAEVVTEKKNYVVNAIENKEVNVEAVIEKAVKDGIEKAKSVIETKDLSDSDPSHGYLPEKIGDRYNKSDVVYGLGLFARDVHMADTKGKVSEKLRKSNERSQKMVEKAIASGLVEKAAGTGLQYGVDSDVGYMIPPEMNMMLLNAVDEKSIIRPKASSLTIGSGSVKLPKVKDYDRSSSLLYGGVLAYWKGEDAQLTESKPKMEELQLNLHQLTVLAYASKQAMTFAPVEIGSYLLPKMTSAIVWKEEYSFVNGNGVGMPLGLINAGCTTAITAESGQTSSANVIVTKNIDNMIARLRVEDLRSVCFLYNRPDLYVWLMNLVRAVGTAGEVARLFSGGITDATLAGIPILDTEHCSAGATAGDVILADLSQYIIADHRSGAEVAQSMHLKFDYGQDAFRIIKFVDAQPINSSAFSRLKSTNTTSSILTIATRT